MPGLLLLAGTASSQNAVTTLKSSTRIVALDVTVLDRGGAPVTAGLTRENFRIAEDGQPQALLSFEPPEAHLTGQAAPLNLFVLDEINSTARGQLADQEFSRDMNQLREGLVEFLRAQPAVLPAETEVLALTKKGFVVVSAPGRDRDALVNAVHKRSPPLPFTLQDAVEGAQYGRSIKALRILALENRSVRGRKNVIWLGQGPPNVTEANFYPWQVQRVEREVHEVTNLLIDARICLTVMGAGIKADGAQFDVSQSGAAGYVSQSLKYPYETDLGFNGFIRATGGEYLNRNDFAAQIRTAVDYGDHFYTLTYRPENRTFDGKFRRIRVSIDSPRHGTDRLAALTKAGYYAIEFGGQTDAAREAQADMSAVAATPLSLTGLHVTVDRMERTPASGRTQFTLLVSPGELEYNPDLDAGTSSANITIALVSLNARSEQVSSQLRGLKVSVPSIDAGTVAGLKTRVQVVAIVPAKAATLRIVVRDQKTGRIGTVDVAREDWEKAPEAVPVAPGLHRRGGD